jgi:hypothetical protein
MTVIDLLIIAVTTYTLWRCRLIGPSKRPSAPKSAFGGSLWDCWPYVCFIFADLVSMYVLPAVASMHEATAFMGTLHRNLNWLVVLFAMIAISAGFIELRRTQIERTEKLEKDGRMIREERDGFRLLVDLSKGDQAGAIAAVENVLARLKG